MDPVVRRDLGRLAQGLRHLDAELESVDAANGTRLELELIDIHDELERTGVMALLTPAESVPIAPDNLRDTLSDRAGIAAVRATLRLAARLASSGPGHRRRSRVGRLRLGCTARC